MLEKLIFAVDKENIFCSLFHFSYVHYEVDYTGVSGQQQQDQPSSIIMPMPRPRPEERTILFPPQWIQCDLRYLDMAILGKCLVFLNFLCLILNEIWGLGIFMT